MNKNLFFNKETVEYSKELPCTYEVHPDSWIFDSNSPVKIQVIYEFEGMEGSDPVFVVGPFERFAYQLNPLDPDYPEGLIFPSDESYGTDRGTLGLVSEKTCCYSLVIHYVFRTELFPNHVCLTAQVGRQLGLC